MFVLYPVVKSDLPSTVLYLMQRLMKTITIKHWLVVNFSAGCDISRLSRDLITCGKNKGIVCSFHF